jgi:hypothetical protein
MRKQISMAALLVLSACAGGGSSGTSVPRAASVAAVGSVSVLANGHVIHPSVVSCTESGSGSFVGGGTNNVAGGQFSAVVGGASNEACDQESAIGGGQFNKIGSTSNNGDSFIGGGYNNAISQGSSAIVGGQDNSITSGDAFLGGGSGNSVSGSYATVGGGSGNTAGSEGAFVGGGFSNTADLNTYTTVGGGFGNTASAEWATVAGGNTNTASGNASNVSGGANNVASGQHATVLGGSRNTASGNQSLAAGVGSTAATTGAFVWSDDAANATALTSTVANQFLARATGGFTFWTNATNTVGATLAPGSGAWASTSDRNMKTDIAALDDAQVLDRVGHLPIATWSYVTEHGVRHVGPMAQDFYAAFGVGADDRHITSIDEDGVALAAIKALRDQNAALRVQQRIMRAKQSAMEREIAQLAVLVRANGAKVAP